MLVRPMMMAPAARNRLTTAASELAAGAFERDGEPAVVTSPRTSNRSFRETGRPARGESSAPAARR